MLDNNYCQTESVDVSLRVFVYGINTLIYPQSVYKCQLIFSKIVVLPLFEDSMIVTYSIIFLKFHLFP